jgi:hypothetical protein
MKSPFFLIKAVSILFIFSLGTLIVSAFVIGVGRFSVPSFMKTDLQEQKPSPNRSTAIPDKGKTTSDVPEAVYKDTLARLRVLRETGTLADFINEGDEIERQWGANGGNNYGLLFRELVSVLQSSRVSGENPGASELSQKYAVTALKKADSFDLETEWFLLTYLQYPLKPPAEDSPEIRKRPEMVRLWLHALHRLESEKDKNFDPDDTGTMNVVPPQGAGPAGMSPEMIKDPKLRAEYEKAIDENNKKIRYRNHQFQLRRHGPIIIREAIEDISKMYTKSPSDMAELTELMVDANISKGLQKNIKIAVEKVVKEK